MGPKSEVSTKFLTKEVELLTKNVLIDIYMKTKETPTIKILSKDETKDVTRNKKSEITSNLIIQHLTYKSFKDLKEDLLSLQHKKKEDQKINSIMRDCKKNKNENKR